MQGHAETYLEFNIDHSNITKVGVTMAHLPACIKGRVSSMFMPRNSASSARNSSSTCAAMSAVTAADHAYISRLRKQ